MLVGSVFGSLHRQIAIVAASSMAWAAPWFRWGRVGWEESPRRAVVVWIQVGRGVWTRSFHSHTFLTISE